MPCGGTLSSLPSGQPSSTQPQAKAFSKQSGCGQTTGTPSLLFSNPLTLIFLLTTLFSEVLCQVTIKSRLGHFISETSTLCVLILSLLQKAGSRASISQAQETHLSLLTHFETAELHAPVVFFSQPLQSNHCPL